MEGGFFLPRKKKAIDLEGVVSFWIVDFRRVYFRFLRPEILGNRDESCESA